MLTLPLAVPMLIFGARATELAIKGAAFAGPMYLLAALAVGIAGEAQQAAVEHLARRRLKLQRGERRKSCRFERRKERQQRAAIERNRHRRQLGLDER